MANLRRDKIIAAMGAVADLMQASGLHPAEGRVMVMVLAYGLGRTRPDCAAPEVEALARELCDERDRAMPS